VILSANWFCLLCKLASGLIRVVANYYKIVSPASIWFDIMVFNLIYHFFCLLWIIHNHSPNGNIDQKRKLYFLHYYPLVRKIIRCKRNFSVVLLLSAWYIGTILVVYSPILVVIGSISKGWRILFFCWSRGVFINIFDTISNGCYILFEENSGYIDSVVMTLTFSFE
jgi:hypothetical protein